MSAADSSEEVLPAYVVLRRCEFTDDHYALAVDALRPEEDQWQDYKYTNFLFRQLDGRPVEYIGCDGGEPEDQTLRRDWSWVVTALNKAHRDGWELAASSTNTPQVTA